MSEAKIERTVPEKTILVVDDDPAVLRVTAEALERAGYCVLRAAGGSGALEIAHVAAAVAEGQQPIDLLLSDVDMPGISGPALAAILQAEWPRTAVMFMSGGAEPKHMEMYGYDWEHTFLRKPFRAAELLAAVGRALEPANQGQTR